MGLLEPESLHRGRRGGRRWRGKGKGGEQGDGEEGEGRGGRCVNVREAVV